MKIYTLSLLLLFQFPIAFNEASEFPSSSSIKESEEKPNSHKSAVANIIFKSTDGGQTWEDISEGLPENSQDEGSFASEGGFYLRAGNRLYHTQPNATAPFWKEEIFPDQHSSIAPGKTGILSYNYNGQFLKRINPTSIWWPMYSNFKGKAVRTIFESKGGAVFIGTDNGLFKSSNGGQTWNLVHTGAMKLVESNGVLMATSQEGIIRSTDNGET